MAQNFSGKYPKTKKGKQKDIYFGTKVADPYRWLEDDLSADTKKWIKEENAVTFDYLEKIPFRDALKKQLTDLWNYEKISAPFKKGTYSYFYKNDGLQQQSVLYRISPEGNEEVFINPNEFSKDGTTSLADVSFSKDGSLCAYQISEGGSDWRKVIVINTDNKKQIGDTLFDVKFSGISWKMNEGFYYSSYDKPKGSELSEKTDKHKLFFHQLGTTQKEDKLIFGGEQTPRRYIGGGVSEDGRFLIISTAVSTTGNELYIQDLSVKNAPIIPIVSDFKNSTDFVYNIGDDLFLLTNFNAPNNRLVKVNLKNLASDNWVDVIPETENVLGVSTSGGYFFAQYMLDAIDVVIQFDTKGNKIRNIELPGKGSVAGFSGKQEDTTLYYTYSNYVTPSTIFEYNIETGKSLMYKTPKIKFNPEDYISEQIFYTSFDGTKIPMMISYKKGIVLDGKNPTILYGYGGFNVSLTPSFSVSNAVWMENGGIFAVPNLRGGGEYGQKWHDGGRKLNKLNVFKDFIAAADYLKNNKYTSTDYLALSGGSNGGLLVGATITLQPDIAKVALPAVGVLDMLRYHKFTAGAGWAYDYGTAEDSKEMFDYLKAYSPIHNVNKGVSYPATLITTGDHDDRVVPAHSYKFAAALQSKQVSTNPVLIRIDTKAGHGAGKSTEAYINEACDRMSFALFNMGRK
ncbi:MAG TPA: prolyl oligopeptidase family serine peptidase [Chitinophagales bacterium]|nr:prolyl oligopeptidase family serine peptidase [Chitinophagales bacterium]HMV03584.1 prolyl oligopeptidase family serine peptidase [Chitinophagales bacterium]HMW94241.1 prolyl oligopeptidase family serine peptidase [Chitinophagales bacterium]HMY42607.1 prolyl oligopeptidase family serine peptidase [Chitinophagales bacterium]HMZ69594.1 prolyl oligopeptidase family serine peptidase [Chitinophagales bacterium]